MKSAFKTAAVAFMMMAVVVDLQPVEAITYRIILRISIRLPWKAT